ncbi:MAG: serine protease, partial [Akkermansiaceae bacterium]|nr:serine protease [Akkermansiaceae bacterium]
VLPRSLRESDRAFLGIEMDLAYQGPGVMVRRVQPETGASSAGLKKGDVITGLLGREVNGNFELSSTLQRLEPGQKIRINFRRGDERKVAEVELGGRPSPQRIPHGRMERMNNMGGHRYSQVR